MRIAEPAIRNSCYQATIFRDSRTDTMILEKSSRGVFAFSFVMCHTGGMVTECHDQHDAIDESLLDCFLELGLKERIQSAANFANAVERLRRLRSTDDPEPAA